MNTPDEKILPQEEKKVLKYRFKALKEKVVLAVFTRKDEESKLDQITLYFLSELQKISDKIVVREYHIGDEESKRYSVDRSPTILIQPDHYSIRYTGAPLGEEGRSFIDVILLASQEDSGMRKKNREALGALNEKRHIQVFVTRSCPYCPSQVLNGFKAAIQRPDLTSAECIDAGEHPDLADRFLVGAVPHTVINNVSISKGLEQEDLFIDELL
jgi:thioredoxin reductase (NADPH)